MTTTPIRRSLTPRSLKVLGVLALTGGLATLATAAVLNGTGLLEDWGVHDMKRPQPSVVTAGTPTCGKTAGTAPSDAIILFDGTNLDAFKSGSGPAKWTVKDGVAIIRLDGPAKMNTISDELLRTCEGTSPLRRAADGLMSSARTRVCGGNGPGADERVRVAAVEARHAALGQHRACRRPKSAAGHVRGRRLGRRCGEQHRHLALLHMEHRVERIPHTHVQHVGAAARCDARPKRQRR